MIRNRDVVIPLYTDCSGVIEVFSANKEIINTVLKCIG